MRPILALILSLAAAVAWAGEDHHEHKAPHGGTLVELGEHFAHLELVLDATTGTLTAYVLDHEAEKSVRLKRGEIAATIANVDQKKDSFDLKLLAVANVLTGETESDSSEFASRAEQLKDAKAFTLTIKALTIKGKQLTNVEAQFPAGNEPKIAQPAEKKDPPADPPKPPEVTKAPEKPVQIRKGPHGGTLVVLNDKVGYVELVIDSEAGKATAYVLGPDAKKPERIEQSEFALELLAAGWVGAADAGDEEANRMAALITSKLEANPEQSLKFKAVVNKQTGETEGDTSVFAVSDERLKKLDKEFKAALYGITIHGSEFKRVELKFPDGNQAEYERRKNAPPKSADKPFGE